MENYVISFHFKAITKATKTNTMNMKEKGLDNEMQHKRT